MTFGSPAGRVAFVEPAWRSFLDKSHGGKGTKGFPSDIIMIELKDGTYYKAIWNYEFRQGDGIVPVPKDGNLLGALFTTDPERKVWTLTYRFRYYTDDVMDETSQDTKNWYKAEATGEEALIWEKVEKAMSMMALAAFAQLNCVMVESDEANVQIEKIQELPGMNIQEKPQVERSFDSTLN